jgi:hypothetical protein
MNKEILEEKVYYYTNVIENPAELVADLEAISEWGEWMACSGEHYVYGTDKTIIPSSGTIFDGAAVNDKIYNIINDAFQAVARDYAEAQGNTDDPKLFPAMPVKKYMAGTSMGAHFDQQEGDDRLKYSLVMYLNDDYEGGEISFTIRDPNGVISGTTPEADLSLASKDSYTFAVKPKAGSVIIFPPSPPYHHTAHLVKSGFKYMVPQHWIH